MCTCESNIQLCVRVIVFNATFNNAHLECGRFEPRSGQTKDFKIGICCFPAKHHAVLRRKSNQNNVSAWSDMSTRGLLFQ